jgi:acyl-CoA synthetase (NDP forming)
VAAARADGRDVLLEHEGLAVAAALGIAVPRHVVVPCRESLDTLSHSSRQADDDDVPAPRWEVVPGERLVIKALASDLPHRSDVGAVRVVTRDDAAAALDDMARTFASPALHGLLVEEFVAHEAGPGGELLLGLRATDDFGPVISLGLGGVHAERLAALLPDERALAILSPQLSTPAQRDRALEASAAFELAGRPQRGRPPLLPAAAWHELLRRWLLLAEVAVAEGLVEFELNPLAIAEGSVVALDALGRLGPPPTAAAAPRPMARLASLLCPRTMAIAGVSERAGTPGRIILQNVLGAGFPPEQLVVIKPGADAIDGCRCVSDLDALGEPVDLLVVAVAAGPAAELTARALRERRARSVILIAGGFDEHEDGAAHAERLREAIAESRQQTDGGGVVNGANCLGVRSVTGRYDTLFIPRHKLAFAGGRPAPLAVVSQSGAFAVAWASRLGALAPRTVVTVGNQIDLTVADHLEYLAGDPGVHVLAAYVEGFRPGDGARVARLAARLASEGRPLVLYRAGRTPDGARASASHTASLAGDATVCRALLHAAGALVADSLEDFTDLTRLACALVDRPVAGLRLGALSNAGFECVAIADHLGPFTLAAFHDDTRQQLARVLGAARLEAVVGVRNPLDVTPILVDQPFAEAARLVLEDPGVDVGVVGCVPLTGALNTLAKGEGHSEDLAHPDSVVERLVALHARSLRPWVAVVDSGPRYDAMAASLEAGGVPTFRHVDRALRVFGQWCNWRMIHAQSNAR